MNILVAASEAVPFSKTGGLADVAGALSHELSELGHSVVLFSPLYRSAASPPALTAKASKRIPLSVRLGRDRIEAEIAVVSKGRFQAALVDYPPFYDRGGLYGENGRDYPDNDVRFAFFSKAALAGAEALGFRPDVAHAHDWQTGLIAAYLKNPENDFFRETATVFTVHNMAYQGNFPPRSLGRCGIADSLLTPEGLEFHGQVGFLKSGLVFSDVLSTVSPSYAVEIQESPERGFGFEGLLRRRKTDLFGILNGLDTDDWNPETDPSLPRNYSAETRVLGKAEAKKALLSACRFKAGMETPLIGIVSRLDRQKGLDIALEALKNLSAGFALVAAGTGDLSLQNALEAFARERPGQVYFHSRFDEAFARRVYAGSDIFLMPSRFEPCGLGQMIAMRYGSIPVASRTGGLKDTVFERPAPGQNPNGFLAEPGDARELLSALSRAIKAYHGPRWDDLVSSAMRKDRSWGPSAAAYLNLYAEARSRRSKFAKM